MEIQCKLMAGSGVPLGQRGPGDDPDRDGLKNILEFALAGNDPMKATADPAGVPGSNGSSVTLTWMPRFASNIYAAISCQQSTSMESWTDLPDSQIALNPDGSMTASMITAGPGPVFLRLKAATTP